ncbi:hypothetical protein I9Y31_001261 [Clostridium perfringens]|nr:hypothetical protein [Clostridium perfringens]
MPFYCFGEDTDSKGRHKMHAYYCQLGPAPSKRIDIGHFYNSEDAFNAAKKMHPSKSFNGCYYCCRSCLKD